MNPLLTFTVVGYEYEYEWHCFINSLLLQTDFRWTCQLWNDGPDDKAREICSSYIEEFPDHFSYTETSSRINDWGHSMRKMGLAITETPYWSTQNADNYLTPVFVEMTIDEMQKKNLDFLVFPCVHNYPNVNGRGTPPYSVLSVAPRKNRCDAGSMVVRTELAQKVGWNHFVEVADGLFIDEIMASKPKPNWGQLPNVLMVHN